MELRKSMLLRNTKTRTCLCSERGCEPSSGRSELIGSGNRETPLSSANHLCAKWLRVHLSTEIGSKRGSRSVEGILLRCTAAETGTYGTSTKSKSHTKEIDNDTTLCVACFELASCRRCLLLAHPACVYCEEHGRHSRKKILLVMCSLAHGTRDP